MRRKDREVTDFGEISHILDKAEVLRIALNNGDFPYILPVNFGYETDGEELVLCFHGSKEGAKHEIIKRDNRVSFEVDCLHSLILPQGDESCTTSFAYASVIGQGFIQKAEESEKAHFLRVILKHYGILSDTFNKTHLENTVVYKIKVTSLTAKARKV